MTVSHQDGNAGTGLRAFVVKSAPAAPPTDDAGRMKPSPYYDRIVDVMEELMKFTLLTRGVSGYLTDRYSERKETAEKLAKRLNLDQAV